MSDDSFQSLSRRLLLQGAAVGTAGAALAACGGDDPPAGPHPDIIPLNALRAAELNAIATYTAGVGILTSPPMGDPQAANAIVLLTIANNWKTQHTTHAAQLATAIRALGGTPVPDTSGSFTPPTGFIPSVTNVLKLACNAEKAAAIAYNATQASLTAATSRFLAATIEGDESQHFIVLYTILSGVAAPNPANIIAGIADVVPKTFVANVGGSTDSLEALADLPYA